MANKKEKFKSNVKGKFYVDEQCIACDACVNEAPDNFEMSEDGHSFVSKQPTSPEEETACKAALESCPVEAIGDDGEEEEEQEQEISSSAS